MFLALPVDTQYRHSVKHGTMFAHHAGKPTGKPKRILSNVWLQKISIPPPWKVIGNSKQRGSQKPKLLKKSMKLNCNFQKGGGGVSKPENLPLEGYGYFLEQHNISYKVLAQSNRLNKPCFKQAFSQKLKTGHPGGMSHKISKTLSELFTSSFRKWASYPDRPSG